MTTINPPLKWHGGKHYLASKIIALMPPHTHYVEPYFGGGSVLLAKNPEGVSEVANDANRGLVNLWYVLSDPSAFAAFVRIMHATPFSEEVWEDMSKPWREHGDIKLAPRDEEEAVAYAVSFFVTCRQSMSGRMKDFAVLSRTRTRRGMNEQASAWMTAVDGLPEVHARLRRVAILNRPALEVIAGQDGEATLFYLDPPYLHETRATTGEYAHEMTADDHQKLLELLCGIKGKFLLSGYDSAMYREFEQRQGWHRHSFDLPNNSAGGDTKRRMTEVVWCNFEPTAEAAEGIAE
ncbi:MAG TPA: DNA adenine methylase [Phycisphaerae bacterium]|nr:DNA adenine methylase [Phycisphaerae bacterium]